jgi:hypothetical protein
VLAVFGGFFVGFVMSLIQYFSEKQKYISEFIAEANTIIGTFYKMKYINKFNPLLVECVVEERRNKLLGADIVGDLEHKYRDHLIKRRKQYDSLKDKEKQISNTHDYTRWYKSRIFYYQRELKKSIDGYIAVHELSLRHFEYIISNFDFLFFNEKIKRNINDKIYMEILKFKSEIFSSAANFKRCKYDDSYSRNCYDLLEEQNKKWFSTKEEIKGNYCHIYVYFEFLNSMREEIEKLRSKFTGNQYEVSKFDIYSEIDIPLEYKDYPA